MTTSAHKQAGRKIFTVALVNNAPISPSLKLKPQAKALLPIVKPEVAAGTMIASHNITQTRLLLELENPEPQQREVLLRRIIVPNRNCEYGRTHDFTQIRDVRDFQRAVPLCIYEDIHSYIDRMTQGEQGVLVSEPVRRFFTTSGSMATPKYIPVTSSFIRDKWRAFQSYWRMLQEHHSGTAHGSSITNFSDGSRETVTAAGLLCGSESSFWNAWGRGPHSTIGNILPHELCRIPNPNARYYTIARVLMEQDVSVVMALNPSTILLLLETMNQQCESLLKDVESGGLSPTVTVSTDVRNMLARTYKGNPGRARTLRAIAEVSTPRLPAWRVWPNLQVVVSWRSPMVHAYIELLAKHLGDIPQRDYILMASEGVVAIPFEDGVSGGALATNIHFYEFIPEEQMGNSDPPTLLAHELEQDSKYVVVLSTSAGLYRYNIGDVVRVKEFLGPTPVLEFLHRIGRTCSLTGEKLTEDQVAQAVVTAASRLQVTLEGFTMYPDPHPFPHYGVVVELDARPDIAKLRRLVAEIDSELSQCNLEYKAKRESQRLGAPELWVVRPGAYASLRQHDTAPAVSDAQIKPACLTRDTQFRHRFEILQQVSCT